MKSQDLFSLKNKKKLKLSSAVVVIGTLKVKYLDRQLRENHVHLDQMPQNAISGQGLHPLALIQ